MASVVKGEDWSSAFGGAALNQGLKELDAPPNNKRTSKYASKPLVRYDLYSTLQPSKVSSSFSK